MRKMTGHRRKHDSTHLLSCTLAGFLNISVIWATTWQNQQNECAPSEDWDQPGHPPSLIRIFAVRMKKAWVLSYPLSAQRRFGSDWADLSLRWAHTHFVGFVMSWLNCLCAIHVFQCVKLYTGTRHICLTLVKHRGIWGNMDRWGIWTTSIKTENIFYKCHVIQTILA